MVTTTTPTGADHLSKALGDAVEHRYLPFDLPGAMARFLDRIGPRVAVVMETEIWPNLLALCRVRRVPVVLANVRLSERSAEGYRRFPRLFAAALDGVAGIAVQSRDDGRRMESIGAPSDVIEVTGSTKFDVPVLASLREEAEALRRTWGAARGIWIAASTHAGEEDLALDAFEHVLEWLPSSLLVLVPGIPSDSAKPPRSRAGGGSARCCAPPGPPTARAHRCSSGIRWASCPCSTRRRTLLSWGGTLVEVGGHNMLEPAALGLPVLFGPHVFNFADISQGLVEAGGAEVVVDSERLGRRGGRLSDGCEPASCDGSERARVRRSQSWRARSRHRNDPDAGATAGRSVDHTWGRPHLGRPHLGRPHPVPRHQAGARRPRPRP